MEKRLTIAVVLIPLVGAVAWAQSSTSGGGVQLITMLVTFGLIIFRVVIGVAISNWAKRLGRDGPIWGVLAGIVSPALIAIILAIAGNKKVIRPQVSGDQRALSCILELDREHKEALEKRFQQLGLDLGNGIRMVVYKWLEEQPKSTT